MKKTSCQMSMARSGLMVYPLEMQLTVVEEAEAQDAIDAIVDHRLIPEKGILASDYSNK